MISKQFFIKIANYIYLTVTFITLNNKISNHYFVISFFFTYTIQVYTVYTKQIYTENETKYSITAMSK